jgi:hypothetical protein
MKGFRNMFHTAPAAEPTHGDVGTIVPTPDDLIPLVVLALSLPEPVEGWTAYLAAHNVVVAEDDIGRPSVARSAARLLLAERRQAEARAREVAERQEQRFIEQDQQRRAELYKGVPWYEIPLGVNPAAAMAQAAKEAAPRRRTPVDDFWGRDVPNEIPAVFGPTPGGE